MAIINNFESKGRSPFYPDQPVPVELFRGRKEQIEYILERGVGQVAAGKPVTMFVEGEYGIGKSSIAAFVQWHAEMEHGLHGIYVTLGGARKLSDLPERILTATVNSGVFTPTRGEEVRNWLSKYIGKQQLFGLSINIDVLRQDAPSLGSVANLLGFLSMAIDKLKDTGIKGLFLILDEINGISNDPDFTHFLKGFVDENSRRKPPVPVLLMLCGVQERRQQLIQHHESVGRIFDVIRIDTMTHDEMGEFFEASFKSVGMTVKPDAMAALKRYAAGFPKLMHLIGNAAFWLDRDCVIDQEDAYAGIIVAARELGEKYVDPQLYKALQSNEYLSILKKIGRQSASLMSFKKQEIIADLTEAEQKRFDNFLQRLKKLKVIKSGTEKGEWVFINRMVRLYIWLQSNE